MVCLLFGNTAFESNVSEQTKKTTFPREGKDAACLVSHWLILPFLDSWIWLSYSTYHRIQNKFAQVRGLARPTVVVAVTRAGFPFQHWVTGTEYPASLDSGLFPLPSAQGKEGRNNHLRANSWQRCPAWGQAGRESPHSTLHPEGGRTGRVSGKHPPRGWGDARPRHLPTYQKQLPGSQEQAIPAHQLSVRAHCPSQHGWVFQKARQGSGCSCYCPTFLFFFFFNISCVLLLSVGERHKYRLVLVLNTSSCLLSQPCRQHYPSSWHHHCLIHLTYAPEKNVMFWTRT